MYNDGESQFASDLNANIPNMSMMMMMTSPVFGNMNFMIQPAIPGKTQGGYPTIPYMSLEALLYNSAMSNPLTAPNNVIGGGQAGVQVLQGSQQIVDNTGTTRMVSGYSQNGF